MPAYSFKERFVPMVKDGSKPGTIRNFRKHPVRVGQRAHLYYGMRTKYCTKLVEPAPVIREVRCVLISEHGVYIFNTNWLAQNVRELLLAGDPKGFELAGDYYPILLVDVADSFAWNDGFRHEDAPEKREGCWQLMLRWWKQTHALPFLGNHIIWGEYK